MEFVKPLPFTEAIRKVGQKSVVGSRLNSAEWSKVRVGLRDRAYFSATIESARWLQRSKSFLDYFISGAREESGAGGTMLKAGSRAQFVKELRQFAIDEGLGPLDPADEGTIKDIRSERRLSLIFNTQIQAAHDYGFWLQGMDEDVLNEFPAQRFIRVQGVGKPRPIHRQWEGEVRLKTDLEFWLMLNDPKDGGFGVPHGPWGFGSGMGVEDVDRDEAEMLGLIEPGEKLKPIDGEFNDRLKASTRGLDDGMLAKLKDAFGSQVEIEGDRVKWKD